MFGFGMLPPDCSFLGGALVEFSDVLRDAMGLFHRVSRIEQVLDPPCAAGARNEWPSVLWRRNSWFMLPRQSFPHLSPASPSHFQLRVARVRSPGRALESIRRACLARRRTRTASTYRWWMLPTVERGPPVHISV